MHFENINEVCELDSEHEVNLYLSAGWLLLNTVAKRDGDRSWFEYCLGWPNELPGWHPGT
jgi:hypothetical protein